MGRDTPKGESQSACSAGYTKSERLLTHLCRGSFLTLWSYPNLYGEPGHELCDLLVIFGNDLLIFSDKECRFPSIPNVEMAWRRWYKRAVLHASEQAWGAERWLRNFPNRVFLDPGCTKPFRLPLPSPSEARFHRVVIAHGAAEGCKQYFGGGSGSLILDSSVIGPDHLAAVASGGRPFVVGQIDRNRGYVHVLDDYSLAVVLRTLDTISDFVAYLRKKEELIARLQLVTATGEEQLLGWYMTHLDDKLSHGFAVPPEMNSLAVVEGVWEDYEQSDSRFRKHEADDVSYAWDRLIEKFSYHAVNGTQYLTTHGKLELSERSFRFLAAEPRIRRRMLAQCLIDLIYSSSDNSINVRVVQPSRPGDPHYVFLVVPRRFARSDDEYRKVRLDILDAYCLVTKLRFREAVDIVGIATDAGPGTDRSEDLLYYDARQWNPEVQAEAKELAQKRGLLTRTTIVRAKVMEYPQLCAHQTLLSSRVKHPRNAPCPCGSGMKYKRCCGR